MTYKIINIEGIGSVNAKELVEAGINTVDDLLQRAKNPTGRKTLEGTTGISGKSILKRTNHADLMHINDVGPQFSELLEATGVNTVKELRCWVTENLQQKLEEINNKRNLVNHIPSVSEVQKMVGQAKELPTIMEYQFRLLGRIPSAWHCIPYCSSIT